MAVNISLLASTNANNINTNFTRVATALADTVSRTGTTPNQMNADLDMNNNDLLNVNVIDAEVVIANGIDISEAASSAAASATIALTQAGIATASAEVAVDAAGIATAASGSIVSNGFVSKAAAEAYSPVFAPDFIRIEGYNSAGDGGGALYKKVGSQPAHQGRFSITLIDTTVVWYELAEEEINFLMFGATTASANAATLIQYAFDYAAAKGASVVDEHIYNVSSVRIKNGTKKVRGRFKATATSPDLTGVVQLDGPTEYGGASLNGVDISVEIDVSVGTSTIATVALKGDAPVNCNIHDCHIFGVNEGFKYGIWLINTPIGNKIVKNKLVGSNAPIVTQNMMSIQGNPIAFGGYLPLGTITRATLPAVRNIISDNEVTGGSYAIILGGAEYNPIVNNTFKGQNHRSVYLGPSAWHNLVNDNTIQDYLSSGVLIGYGSSFNIVSDNDFTCDPVVWGNAGEATVNINTGGTDNIVTGNRIKANKGYGVYMGCGVSRNLVANNRIEDYWRCAICVESDWATPAPYNYARPNYAAPSTVEPTATAWAFANSVDNVIQGNSIGAAITGVGSAEAAISIGQVGATWECSSNIIQNNVLTDDTGLNHYVYLYEATAGKSVNNRLLANSFDTRTLARFFFSQGRAHFAKVDGNDNLNDPAVPVSIVSGDTTPSVAYNDHIQLTTTAGTSITNFSGGIDGQVIVVRLTTNWTLVHGASTIRLKSATNVVATSNIQFLSFVRIAGVWWETWRNF